MLPETQPAERIAFGSFELETTSGDLFRSGRRIRLSGQPADLLVMLVRHSGQLVSREELRAALWPEDTFVDFDHGLNNCIRRIRDALGDSADAPRFIETLPKKGYRFIAEVRSVSLRQDSPPVAALKSAILEPEIASATPRQDDVQHVSVSRWKRLRPLVLSFFAVMVALSLFVLGSLLLKHKSFPAGFHSVVLLPLTNLSGDSSLDYLSDGVTEELITELAQATSVSVISRTSAMLYKGKQKPMPVIARELGVDAVVEGTLSRTGDHLRMTAHLIDGTHDKSLWAQSYEGDMSNVRELEIRVAADIATHLRAPAPARAQNSPPRAIATDAYEEYLKAQFFWEKGDLHTSLRHFERAVVIDPDYAAAYGGLARAYTILYLGDLEEMPPDVALPKISRAAEKALRLDKQNADAHAAYAFLLSQRDWNWRESEAELLRAISSNPSDSYLYRWYSIELGWRGHLTDALKQAQLSVRLDPVSWHNIGNYADLLMDAGNLKESIEQYQAALELNPNDTDYRCALADAFEKK
jgi:TolB-like protein/DNA-binding winged helix-turn-helix (wHTH) protein/Tfp pilus assembly protein PilF